MRRLPSTGWRWRQRWVLVLVLGGTACGWAVRLTAQPIRHTPPPLSRERLGTLSFEGASAIDRSFEGQQALLRLKGGALYIEADMDIDADGSPRARTIDPGNGQLQTSLNFPHESGQRQFVDAEKVPYFVLPGNRDRSKRLAAQMGIGLGDVAAVVFRDKVEYAVFADTGPAAKIGEGSIKLAQSLGHDPFIVRHGKRVVGRSIPRDVIYIVFPGSRDPNRSPDTIVERTREKGRELFRSLGGKPD
jgi:hypothetical protein